MHATVRSSDDVSGVGGQRRLPMGSGHRSPQRACQHPLGEGARSTEPWWRRTSPWSLVLRGGIAAIGLLLVALLTATGASAQSADLAITAFTDSPDPVAAGGTLTYTVTVINNGPNAASNVVVSHVTPPNTIANMTGCPMGWATSAVGVPVPTPPAGLRAWPRVVAGP